MDLSKLDRYGNRAEFVEAVQKRAYDYDFNCHGCSQAVVQCFLDREGGQTAEDDRRHSSRQG